MKRLNIILNSILIFVLIIACSACKDTHIHEFISSYDEDYMSYSLTCECGEEQVHVVKSEIITEPTIFSNGLRRLYCKYNCDFEVEQEFEYDYKFFQVQNGEIKVSQTTIYTNIYNPYANPYYKIEAVPAEGYHFAYWEVYDVRAKETVIEYKPYMLVFPLRVKVEHLYEYKPVFVSNTEESNFFEINPFDIEVYINGKLQTEIPEFFFCTTYHVKDNCTYTFAVNDKDYKLIEYYSVHEPFLGVVGDIIKHDNRNQQNRCGTWRDIPKQFGDITELIFYLETNI